MSLRPITQDEYESMWFGNKEEIQEKRLHTTSTGKFLMWFSAQWCKPCQRMIKEKIIKTANDAGIPLYYCDQTVNNYTPGYCGVRAFPTFMLCSVRKVVATISSSDTEFVCTWIAQHAAKEGVQK
jgi:thiol-disulfide isomerase/thioredoxin